MVDLTDGGWVLCLAAADAVAILALVLLIEHRARSQTIALEDARHEFETGLAFLDSRLRARRAAADKLPPIEDEGT
ncbi:MAG: hypothetical protein CMF64_04405 [Magnetovibrio sp.]|nr:hypothetical protein [Magnetovibrio sp.]